MSCKGGACSIHSGPKAQPVVVTTRRSSKPIRHHKHHDNCAICHDHKSLKDEHDVSHVHENLHKHDHSCHDHNCEHHGTPHGHIVHHDEHHEHPNTLESIIGHSKLPQWLKELCLNISFLSPAMIISKLLSQIKMPQIFKSLASITGMHIFNRGKTKLGRLGLTCLVSGAATSGESLSVKPPFMRFLATTAVAIIEKFAGDGHGESLPKELKAFEKNIKDSAKWKELLPSLINVESKVQVISPLINKLIQAATQTLAETPRNIIVTLSQILFTSLGFVGFDQILKSLAGVFGQGSVFASMTGAVCGCCGSPVCAAAATDSALSNTL